MYFADLLNRLIEVLRTRLHNGELTERRLARSTLFSQPYMHNVLKGARSLSPKAADQILRQLGLTVVDLLMTGLPDRPRCTLCIRGDRYAEVPVLDGWLGPGVPIPHTESNVEAYPFLRSFVVSLGEPVMARVAKDDRMRSVLRENDLVLLDRAPERRLHPTNGEIYVVSHRGEGLIRRVERVGTDCLLLTSADAPEDEPPEKLTLESRALLEVVLARVAWIGRTLPGH